MPAFRFRSPYPTSGFASRWLRGNHHGHSTRSDGDCAPEVEIESYAAAGYDYIALSEHDLFVSPGDYAHLSDMTILPAVEMTSATGQTLMYLGADADIPGVYQRSLAELARFVGGRGGLFIVDHPNWLYRPQTLHASVAEIAACQDVEAIEIYTGVIERMAGSPHALDVWDRLLSLGRRIYGHAVDDQHCPLDRFLGWNMVQFPSEGANPDARDIIRALSQGRFYATTGPCFLRLGVSASGEAIEVETDAEQIRWITRDGIVAHQQAGPSGRLEMGQLAELPRIQRLLRQASMRGCRAPDDLRYIRVELRGAAGASAWSQPFFIEPLVA